MSGGNVQIPPNGAVSWVVLWGVHVCACGVKDFDLLNGQCRRNFL